jgi:hypothetical protein
MAREKAPSRTRRGENTHPASWLQADSGSCDEEKGHSEQDLEESSRPTPTSEPSGGHVGRAGGGPTGGNRLNIRLTRPNASAPPVGFEPTTQGLGIRPGVTVKIIASEYKYAHSA